MGVLLLLPSIVWKIKYVNTFNEVSKLKDVPKGLPVIPEEMQPKFKLINKKPIIATEEELNENHRSHSAKLRVIERVRV